MLNRLVLVILASFWLVMNYLLWRSEFGGGDRLGTGVPLEVVWQKILTAPDNSRLQILQKGKKIGVGTWSSNTGLAPHKKQILDGPPPDGLEEGPAGYRLDFEGNLNLPDFPDRIRYDLSLRLSTNHAWQDFSLNIRWGSSACEIHSSAAQASLRIALQMDGEKTERTIQFADLQNPEVLAKQFDIPLVAGAFANLGLPSSGPGGARPSLSPSLDWKARTDWVTVGHTAVRGYSLRASFLDHYRIIVMVSQVGELLKIDLPNNVTLVNEQLMTF